MENTATSFAAKNPKQYEVYMKIRSLVSILLAFVLLFSMAAIFTACGETPADTTASEGSTDTSDSAADTSDSATDTSGSSTDTPDVTANGKINVKFFKVGKANATLIRTPSANILIDCGEEEDEDGNGKQDDGEKILEFLAEKGVTKIDLLIVTQFNKNHYGSVPTILEGVTVEKVIEPSYTKTGATYTAYRNALTAASLTAEAVTEKTTLTYGDASLTVYPTTLTTVSADQDEFNSLAVAFEYGDFSMLLASDVFGARTNALIEELNGKTFDILQIPFHGTYNDTVGRLVTAVDPDYAIIFASDNNPEDVRVINLLNADEITTFITKNGSVEAKLENGILTVKQ